MELFEKQEINQWLASPHNPESLVRKVYCVIIIATACRGGEVNDLRYCSVERINNMLSRITFRQKRMSVIGELENDILAAYLNAFPDNLKSGKLFKKLSWSNPSDGTPLLIRGTGCIIGKITMANYCKDIAKYLGLPEPDRFTGKL
jgi:hypothetical protein